MRQFALVTIGALGKGLRCKVIVRTTLGGARFGMTPFWIRHGTPLILQLLLDLAQSFPTRIADVLLAIALLKIQVLAAVRA